MGSRWVGMMRRLQGFLSRRAIAATLVTAVTLVLVGGVVVLTTTSIGCGPAAKLGLKGVSIHCKTAANVTALASPSPTTAYSPPVLPSSTPPPSAPTAPPVSEPSPPVPGPVSQAYPPFTPPVSGPSGTVIGSYPLTCRLPVYAGQPGSGGFIQFPGASFTPDPSSAVVAPSPGPLPGPYGGYGGYGGFGLAYDHEFSRWLPVPYSSVSPDGSRYAYSSGDSVYVVAVRDGTQTRLGQGHIWRILSVGAQGVYATITNQAGIWLVPFTGDPKLIKDSGFWQAASTNYAYGTATSQLPYGLANTILRLDLNTGAISDWFTHKLATSSLLGLDAQGHPLLSLTYFANNASEVGLVVDPAHVYPIFSQIPGNAGLSSLGTPIADSHGIWFPVNYWTGPYGTNIVGLVLFVPGSGLYWMSSYQVQLAGDCS